MVQEAYEQSLPGALSLRVEGDGRIWAEKARVVELFDNAVRLAAATDSTELVVGLTTDGFVIETDGGMIDASDTEELFEYGTAVPHADAGMLGPNLRSLAQAHGWSVTAASQGSRGIKITVTGARVELDSPVEAED